jgi:hypothetical protein
MESPKNTQNPYASFRTCIMTSFDLYAPDTEKTKGFALGLIACIVVYNLSKRKYTNATATVTVAFIAFKALHTAETALKMIQELTMRMTALGNVFGSPPDKQIKN